VDRVSKLELEWWIIHRERARHQPSDLEHALAALQAEIYSRPEDMFLPHARARAEAMLIRDERAEAGGVSEHDWDRIGALLDSSWVSAQRAAGAQRADEAASR
jgi:hypothetical protein